MTQPDFPYVSITKGGREYDVGLVPFTPKRAEFYACKLPKIFHGIYNEYYANHEVYQTEWWKEQSRCSKTRIHLVMAFPQNHVEYIDQGKGIVAGSVITDKYLEPRRTEIGKVTIATNWQGLGISSKLGPYAMAFARDFSLESPASELFFSETRTDKPSTQKHTQRGGMLPAALIFNKLSTINGPESTMVMVLPLNLQARLWKPTLHEEFKSLYDYAKSKFFLNDDQKTSIHSEKGSYIISEKLEKTQFCSIAFTPQLNHPKKIANLEATIKALNDEGFSNILIEFSPYNRKEQQLIKKLDLLVVGYVPAWEYGDNYRCDRLYAQRIKNPPPRNQISTFKGECSALTDLIYKINNLQ